MTLQQLNYAIQIADTGSMNRAAERLFVSQPSLTNSIKELERELGIIIFQRSSRGVTPTSEGLEFLASARQLYQQYELLQEKYEKGDLKRKFGVSTQHYTFAVKAFVETVKHFDTRRFEFAIRETRTRQVVEDVGQQKSEIGILYVSHFNRKVITKMLRDQDLEFHSLVSSNAYVYLWKGHPLAAEDSIGMSQLEPYPCLSFEQGRQESVFLAEEILSEKDYPRVIRGCDRATMLNLMQGLNGYMLCSGIIMDELNGGDYISIPFRDDALNHNTEMEIGYIVKRHYVLSDIGEIYLNEVRKCLGAASP